MIRLHQFPAFWGVPNLSPFCLKVEIYLRMVGLPYEIVEEHDPGRAPKGKLPFIEDHGRVIGDSGFILDYLKERYGDPLDGALTPEQTAQAVAFRRLIEENLYWVMVYSRWSDPAGWEVLRAVVFGSLPLAMRWLLPSVARSHVLRELRCQGMGRHQAEEIYAIGKSDVCALSNFLADRPYFLGPSPTTLDACAFGLLACVLYPPIESPLKAHVAARPNLVAYCHRLRERYWPGV